MKTTTTTATTTAAASAAVLIADPDTEAAVEKFAALVALAESERAEADAAAAAVKAATADLETLGGLDPLDIVRRQEGARIAKMKADAAAAQARRYGDAIARFQNTARRVAAARVAELREDVSRRLESALKGAGFGDAWQVAAGLHPLSAELHRAQAIGNFPTISLTQEDGGKRYGIAPREALSAVVQKLDSMRVAVARLRAFRLSA